MRPASSTAISNRRTCSSPALRGRRITSLLEKDPTARPPNALAVVAEIDRLLAGPGGFRDATDVRTVDPERSTSPPSAVGQAETAIVRSRTQAIDPRTLVVVQAP